MGLEKESEDALIEYRNKSSVNLKMIFKSIIIGILVLLVSLLLPFWILYYFIATSSNFGCHTDGFTITQCTSVVRTHAKFLTAFIIFLFVTVIAMIYQINKNRKSKELNS